MSRTLDALKRAQAQRFAQPALPVAAADEPLAPQRPRAGLAAGAERLVWIAVGVLACVAVLTGWWAFGPSLVVKVGAGAAAATRTA